MSRALIVLVVAACGQGGDDPKPKPADVVRAPDAKLAAPAPPSPPADPAATPTCDQIVEHLWQMRLADTAHPMPDVLKKDPAKLAKLRELEASSFAPLCKGSPSDLRCIMKATSRADLDKCD